MQTSKNLKKLSLLLITLFASYLGYSSGTPTVISSAPASMTPMTPEAAGFAKYGDVPVSTYSGIPSVSIPIYSITTKDGFSLPIGLNHHGGGVQVDALATTAGMNMTLGGGGVITRTVHDICDFDQNGYFHSQEARDMQHVTGMDAGCNTAIGDAGDFLNKYFMGRQDMRVDAYSLNLPGVSSSFTFDTLGQIHFIPANYVLEVNPPSTADGEWVVTTENGTKFYFGGGSMHDPNEGAIDWTLTVDGSAETDDVRNAVAWYLTKVKTPFDEEIHLEYQTYQTVYSYPGYRKRYPYYCGGGDFSPLGHPGVTAPQGTINHTYGKVLKKITYSMGDYSQEVEMVYGDDRCDMEGALRLDEVIVRESGSELKRVELFYTCEEDKQRMWLDSLHTVGKEGTILPGYAFEYHRRDELPPRFSTQQDHWGFANSNPNSTTLCPTIDFGISYFNDNGADRSPDAEKMLYGTMKRVYYPSGGYSEFVYEPKMYYQDQANPNVMGGGVRIQKVITHDGMGDHSNDMVKRYEYWADEAKTISSGKLMSPLQYYFISREDRTVPIGGVGGGTTLGSTPNFNPTSSDVIDYLNDELDLTLGQHNWNATVVDWYVDNPPVELIDYVNPGYSQSLAPASGGTSGGTYEATCWYISSSAKTVVPMSSGAGGNPHGHDKVTIYFEEEGTATVGKVEYEYSNDADHMGIVQTNLQPAAVAPYLHSLLNSGRVSAMPSVPSTNFGYANGLLERQKSYRLYNGQFILSSETVNDYVEVDPVSVMNKLFHGGMFNVSTSYAHCQNVSSATYFTKTAWVRLKSTTTTNYDGHTMALGNSMSGTTSFTYGNPKHMRMTERVTQNQLGDELKTKVYYPIDHDDWTNSIYNTPTHLTYVPVKEEVYKNGVFLNGWINSYNGKGQLLSSYAYNPISTNSYPNIPNNYDRVGVYEYDGSRLKQATPEYGHTSTYVWTDTYYSPIASILNAEAEEVAYAGFESSDQGGWTYPVAYSEDQTAQLKAKTGSRYYDLEQAPIKRMGIEAGSYVLSFWINDTNEYMITAPFGGGQQTTIEDVYQSEADYYGWVYVEKEVTLDNCPNSGCSIRIIGNNDVKLDELRWHPADSYMSTHSMNENQQVVTSTGLESKSGYYEYDEFGRLKLIRDEEYFIRGVEKIHFAE